MTNQHQATPDEWAQQEDWANRSAFSDSSCIIELRDRVEALEATQQPRAFTGQVVAPITNQTGPGVALYLDPSERQHGVTSDRLIARNTPAPAGSLVERIATDAELCQVYNEKTTLRAVYDLGREHGAAPTRPGPESSPAGSLMDRLAVALLNTTRNSNADTKARAVILEVAAWLKEKGYNTLQAEALAQEANR
jgi:hypothetical protein